jgi:hypothetical protein
MTIRLKLDKNTLTKFFNTTSKITDVKIEQLIRVFYVSLPNASVKFPRRNSIMAPFAVKMRAYAIVMI